LKLFIELKVGKCVIRCFKWFSNVLLRLKPRDLDFSTSSLSKYKTRFRLVPIAFTSKGKRREVQCYKFGHYSLIVKTQSVLFDSKQEMSASKPKQNNRKEP